MRIIDHVIQVFQCMSVYDTNDCEEVLNSVILVFIKRYNEWAIGRSIGVNMYVSSYEVFIALFQSLRSHVHQNFITV